MERIRSRDDIDRAVDQIASTFSGEIGFAARNLASGETIERDAEAIFPTASVIKLAVLVEVFRQAAEEGLDLSQRLTLRDDEIVRGSGILKEMAPGLEPTIDDLAMLMVVLSDNTATNMLIDLVGGVEAVNRTVHDRLGLRSIVLHNRIDFDRIGGEVRRFAESSPRDLMTLVARLVRDEIVNADTCRAMRDIMQRQQYLDQMPRYINFNPYAKELRSEQSVWVGCKTGFFPGTRVDAGFFLLPDEVAIAYCAMTTNGADATFAAENESAIVNGLLGRAILDYWWPGESIPDGVLLETPYATVARP